MESLSHTALKYAINAVIAPDGRHLYSTASSGSLAAWFEINQVNGALEYAGVFQDAEFGGGSVIAISHDSAYVYATSDTSDTLLW